MRIKIEFSSSERIYKEAMNGKVNGFINYCLGENNIYHGNFSNYCVSSLQGGHMNKKGELSFPEGSYLYVSSSDGDFIETIIETIMSSNKGIDDMNVTTFSVEYIQSYSEYDIIRTISPVMLVWKQGDKKRIVTVKDSDFFEILTEQSKLKLIKQGHDEEKVKTLKIEPFHIEKAKTKDVVIKGIHNITSMIMAVVKGDAGVRCALYELGLGKSTGYGFGAVETGKNKKK